jgi:hypothetical protein
LTREEKEKEKLVNSIGPEVAHTAQSSEKTGRARARAGIYAEKSSGPRLSGDKFLYCFAVSLTDYRIALRFSISLPDTPSTASMPSRAPASACTGRKGQRLGFPSSGHQISLTPSISPTSIARMATQMLLTTVIAETSNRIACSQSPMAV